jgi:hypothetical protein
MSNFDSYVLNPRHDIQSAIDYKPIFGREERIAMAQACEHLAVDIKLIEERINNAAPAS